MKKPIIKIKKTRTKAKLFLNQRINLKFYMTIVNFKWKRTKKRKIKFFYNKPCHHKKKKKRALPFK